MKASNIKKITLTGKDQSGMALFMVMSAMMILSVLIIEFAYVTQVNAKIAYDSVDTVKAHYLAKSGLKISLLRLKVFKTLSEMKNLPVQVPQQVLDQLWGFPFVYPIPALPDLSITARGEIEKFQKESGLEGSFTSSITSESTKLNINSAIPGYRLPVPAPSTSPSGAPSPTPSPSVSLSAAELDIKAKESLMQQFEQILTDKRKSDPFYDDRYRDYNFEDFSHALFAWTDPFYQTQTQLKDDLTYKHGPFYSLTELHLLSPMLDDLLVDLFSPQFTAAPTAGLNVNKINQTVLKLIAPKMTDEELTEFFKYRDDPEADNSFKKIDDFYEQIKKAVAYANDDGFKEFKQSLEDKQIKLILNEASFKIVVKAQVNQATRVIEAWVQLESPTPSRPGSTGATSSSSESDPNNENSIEKSKSGLKISYIRIL